MGFVIYKWLIVFALSGFNISNHPIFVSVTEIEHNSANNSLEISCKIFTDDFETTLRKKYNTKIDLLDVNYKPAMNDVVNKYIQNHLSVILDNNAANLQFVGFEQQEEGITSYFEVKNISSMKKVRVVNNILYEYYPQQMGIVHITVNGTRKSARLNNPDSTIDFLF